MITTQGPFGGGALNNYLLLDNRRTGQIDIESFEGPDGREAALRRRVEAESTPASRDIEIVVIAADSESGLRKTHRRYFESVSDMLRGAALGGPSI